MKHWRKFSPTFVDAIDNDHISSDGSDPWSFSNVEIKEKAEMKDSRGSELKKIFKSIGKNEWQFLNEDTASKSSVITAIQQQPKKDLFESSNKATSSTVANKMLKNSKQKQKKVVRFATPVVATPRKSKNNKPNAGNTMLNMNDIRNLVGIKNQLEYKSKENSTAFNLHKEKAAFKEPQKVVRLKAGSDKAKGQRILEERPEFKKIFSSSNDVLPKVEVDKPFKQVPSKPKKIITSKAKDPMKSVMNEANMGTKPNEISNKSKRMPATKDKTPITMKNSVKSDPPFNMVMQQYLKDLKEAKKETEKQARMARLPKEFKCNICGLEYRVKSILEAHKREKHPNTGISPRKEPPTGSATTTMHKCIYCDKIFARINALHIHHMRHCTKIPPREKKNLQYTELEHVQKPVVPVFRNLGGQQPNQPHNQIDNRLVNKPHNKANSPDGTQKQNVVAKMTTEISAAGVLEPAIGCFLCKERFDSVLDFTKHSMVAHANTKKKAF